jgi:hypothetical protein
MGEEKRQWQLTLMLLFLGYVKMPTVRTVDGKGNFMVFFGMLMMMNTANSLSSPVIFIEIKTAVCQYFIIHFK